MPERDSYSFLGPEEADLVRHRRAALEIDEDAPLCGLALSGGGIRSATFALGLIQGMARNGWLQRIDIMSTVSGGGYAGAFLRSLFIPRRLRFRDPGDPPPGQDETLADSPDFRERHDWAIRMLQAPAGLKRLEGDLADADAATFPSGDGHGGHAGAGTANPLWWLREHGRYLTPNGGGDYIFSLGYIIRAWFAMQYVAIVPLLAIFVGFKLLTAAGYFTLRHHWPQAQASLEWLVSPVGGIWFKFSPLMALPVAVLLLAAIPISTCYWLTATATQWQQNPMKARISAVLLGLAALFAATLPLFPRLKQAIGDYVWLGPYFAFVQSTATIGLVAANNRAGDPRREIFNSEVRRLLTDWLALVMKAGLFLLALAIIDSFALSIVYAFRRETAEGMARVGGIAAMIPVIVWIVHKLQALLPRFAKFAQQTSMLNRWLPGLILAMGLFAGALIGTLCATLAYMIVWEGIPFRDRMLPLSASAIWVVVLLLTIVVGLSPRFLNLSSLHYLYAGRLTRAYLGASNARRLARFGQTGPRRSAGNVREYDEADAISLAAYHHKAVLAPVHLVNVTANETRETSSQLVQRDRKGRNMCVGPGGISLGSEFRTRAELAAQNAESLAIGKWIAISGAAASSAMGQATSLGSALLLTFANVRLGYWWYAPELAGRMSFAQLHRNIARYRHSHRGTSHAEIWQLRDLFETQSYLLNEAAAEYSRVGRLRLNLTDGGHFENSGAYELIRRRLPVIIVSDAAADPGYEFDDFANLVRKARIDLGAEVRCLDPDDLRAFPVEIAALCGSLEDFRNPQAQDRLCLVPCRIEYADGAPPSLMILVKPRVPEDAPPDIATYARTCRAFPQEPTVDQFFGEAQWESYRMLGEILSERIFAPNGLDAMLTATRRWRDRPSSN